MKMRSLRMMVSLAGAMLLMKSCSPGFDPATRTQGEALASDAAKPDSRMPWSGPVEKERPGLATGWGDKRQSQLGYTSFQRASSKPAGTDMIFYNDAEGVTAMAPGKERVGGMQTAAGNLVEWGIKGGMSYLPTYKEHGYGRRLVAGKKSSDYSIVIKNRSLSALEVVTSVDGLDVMDGKSASFSKRGYVIEAGETLEINGFRTSTDSVAAFQFSGVAGSYANLKHGDTRNVGVIGLAVFTKKGVDPWKWTSGEIQNRDHAKAFAEEP
jgi:hypothetical protein